jgi:L-lactate dehydrogenase (cytochrome)
MDQYTMVEVREHDQKEDCWIVINRKVYDITNFLSEHPGGSSILVTVSGQDATDYFEELHRPEILDEIAGDYLIGELVQTNSSL